MLSVWCIYEYSLDKDLTLIEFKKFQTKDEDIYPSTSFCFFGPYEVEKLKSVGENITESKYIKFLQGRLWQEEMIHIGYDDVTIDIDDYIVGYDIKFDDEEKISNITPEFLELENKGWNPPYASLTNPDMKCFTLDIPYQHGKLLKYISIRIKTNIFRNGIRPHKYAYNLDDTSDGFYMLLHYPKQIVNGKSAGEKSWRIRGVNDSLSYTTEFYLRNIEMIHHRNKPRSSCQEHLFDLDKLTFDTSVKRMGCKPPYINLETNVSSCKTMQQLEQAYGLFGEYDTYDVSKVPCRTLGRFDFDQWEYDNYMPADQQPHFTITINYLDSNYREIREIKAFNLQTLFGNIGGYVGIFIGYALLTLPDAIINILKLFRGRNKFNSKEADQEIDKGYTEKMV